MKPESHICGYESDPRLRFFAQILLPAPGEQEVCPEPTADDSKCINECNTCGKRFLYKCNLRVHVRFHTGTRPYKCGICDRHFFQKSHLTRHELTHNGRKPYRCNLCKKEFPERKSLNRHKKLHSGEKPFKCDLCGKGYADKHSVSRHKLNHNGEKRYGCEICFKKFTRKSHVVRHMKNIHGRDITTKEVSVKTETFQEKLNGVCPPSPPPPPPPPLPAFPLQTQSIDNELKFLPELPEILQFQIKAESGTSRSLPDFQQFSLKPEDPESKTLLLPNIKTNFEDFEPQTLSTQIGPPIDFPSLPYSIDHDNLLKQESDDIPCKSLGGFQICKEIYYDNFANK